MLKLILILLLFYGNSDNAIIRPKVPLSKGRVIWQFKNCDIDNLEECAQMTMLYGYRGLIFAKNKAEMPEWCEETRLAMKCVTDWGKNCINQRLMKQLLSILMRGPKKSRRQICSQTGIRYYLENYQCLNASINGQHDCIDLLKDDIQKIMSVNNKDLWIQQGCCFVDKWKRCFDSVSRHKCNKPGVKFLKWASEPYLADMMDLFCQKDWTWNSQQCRNAIAFIPQNIQPNNVKFKSIIYPVFKMVTEFIDDKGLDNFDI